MNCCNQRRTSFALVFLLLPLMIQAWQQPASSLSQQRHHSIKGLNALATPPSPRSSKPTLTVPPPPPQPKMITDMDEDEEEKTRVELQKKNNKKKNTFAVRIHNVWYDLTKWRAAHPAGEHWIDYYRNRDATEVMDGFHSQKARQMMKRLPTLDENTNVELQSVPQDTPLQLAFRDLFTQLEKDGWWKRDLIHEAKLLFIWASLVVGAFVTGHLPATMEMAAGTMVDTTTWATPTSILLLSLAFTNAGWLGHDYVHGIDDFSFRMRNFCALTAGLAPTWWSDKHNKHHALTNEMGVDEDIATDPFLYQWSPDPSNDSPLRKIQHYIFWIPFSMLFALWRYDSIMVAIQAVEQGRPKAKDELYCLLLHYLILFNMFGIQIWLPAVLFSGLISALIVTPTHQSEEMFDTYQSDWVMAQFASTRSAVMTNPYSEWLWGGMQYQLEHHLFPSMPRQRYPQLKQVLQDFAKQQNVPGGYRDSGEWEILKMNWELYKKVAEADPVSGAPPTRGILGQQAAIINTNTPAAGATATAGGAMGGVNNGKGKE